MKENFVMMLVELEIKDVEIRINETFRIHEKKIKGGRDEMDAYKKSKENISGG